MSGRAAAEVAKPAAISYNLASQVKLRWTQVVCLDVRWMFLHEVM